MSDFDRTYASKEAYFSNKPSSNLSHFLTAHNLVGGRALDLGCGQGRNAIFLAKHRFSVVAMDISEVGLRDLRSSAIGQSFNICCVLQDVTTYHYPPEQFDFVIAGTILDHLQVNDIPFVADGIMRTLVKGGFAFISVFTTADDGYISRYGKNADVSPSECSSAINHYFGPHELSNLFNKMKILEYHEKRELDTKHGAPHWHGMARIIFEK